MSIRSINYDEKDPFLCNACGFCKYARFDFMLYAKPCCAVDPIENEEDRKKVRSHSCVKRVINGVPFPKTACMAHHTFCPHLVPFSHVLTLHLLVFNISFSCRL